MSNGFDAKFKTSNPEPTAYKLTMDVVKNRNKAVREVFFIFAKH